MVGRRPGVFPAASGSRRSVRLIRLGESEGFQTDSRGFLETELHFEDGLELAENKRKNRMTMTMMMTTKKAERGVRTVVQAERTARSKVCRCEVACCGWDLSSAFGDARHS